MIAKITALCVAVALICSMLRLQRPELATALSLVGGLAVVMLLLPQADGLMDWISRFERTLPLEGDIVAVVLKGAGITLLSEMGAQLCVDAGESALAGRIALAARVCMLGLCAPLIAELTGLIGDALW